MASRQQFKGDRAEAAAKLCAQDIGDVNRANERDEGYTLNSETNFKQARAEAASKLAAKDLEDVNRAKQSAMSAASSEQHQQKPGVIGSMLKAVQGTYEHAKEAVVGKGQETGEVRDTSVETFSKDQTGSKMGEYTDFATQKARERNEATKQKAGEYADYASQKAKETKDTTMNKAGEYKDYAAEKAKEAKDATMQKAGEYKDYTAEKAKEAKDATMNKAGEYKDYTAEKAKEGKDTTVGKLGELKDSAADAAKRAMGFFTGKKDEAKDMVSGTEEGEARRRMEELRMQQGGEKTVVRMEETRPGLVADALKAVNQTVNDTGRVEEEGVIHVERRREKM
ncbi:Late embryogenesis abundant protein [Sesbania bispinosa]|nr:Late embryogenesis abundant protein [Sesbania bispinosa]